jgi:hypothetical protein
LQHTAGRSGATLVVATHDARAVGALQGTGTGAGADCFKEIRLQRLI